MRTITGILVVGSLVLAAGCKRNVVIKSSLAPAAAPAVAPAAAPAAGMAPLQDALRKTASAQEIFYSNPANRYTYAADAAQLRYQPPEGVTVTVLEAGSNGWAAVSRYNGQIHDGLAGS